jgi:hypothetical protein
VSITIYRDDAANAIFIEDANGAQFLNSLQATLGTLADSCSITDTAKSIEIVTSLNYAEYVDENGDNYGNNEVEVCNNLNAIFQVAGSTGNIPEITSSLTASLTTGDTLNYILTANYGVGYEWDFSTVAGVVNVDGNPRKIIGGSGLGAGVYNIPVKAINYYGEDSETIVLTVSNPPYNNTKSINFVQNDYMNATANSSNPLYRLDQNSATPWTIVFWFKSGTSNNQNQTIISFGGNDLNNEGRVDIIFNGNNASRRQIILTYGTNNNRLQIASSVGASTAGVWNQWVITYDGGTTENGSGGINTSYTRFKIFKNGVQETTVNSNNNFGYSAKIFDEVFRIGRQISAGNYMRNNCRIDELALWNSDQSANASTIYNSGNTQDLGALSPAPAHYWRMGDGDIYPLIEDQQSTIDFTMTNMTVADIVSDVP